MNLHRSAGVWVFCLLVVCDAALVAGGQAAPAVQSTSDDAVPLFRVFLKDGTTLVSYGEFARVDGQIVMSMPTSPSVAVPQLQLITIPADRVDWERTLNYAETVRSSRYQATRAEADYRTLTTEVEQELSGVALAATAAARLAIVERARKRLAEWPAVHFNYKRDEILQMVGVLDEAVADLRAASGASSFDLSLVAVAESPGAAEPLLPAPTARESLEQVLAAAKATVDPAERVSLLTLAVNALDAERQNLPAEWYAQARAESMALIAKEQEIDRNYQIMSARLLRLATARAVLGDVRGVQGVLASIPTSDASLGTARPAVVASLAAAVEEELSRARALRLERDSWALRVPALRAYRASIARSLLRLQRLTPLLEDIKSLAGSGPDALGSILRGAALIQKSMATIEPPSELRDVHNLLVSAVQLADSAARTRREAAIKGNMARAWDASSAAAGALMLAARARTDLQLALRPPQFKR